MQKARHEGFEESDANRPQARIKSSPPATIFAVVLISVVVAIVGYLVLTINFSNEENASELEKSKEAQPLGQANEATSPAPLNVGPPAQ